MVIIIVLRGFFHTFFSCLIWIFLTYCVLFRYEKIRLNDEESLKKSLNISLDDVWTEFLYLQGSPPFPLMRCAAVTMPPVPNDGSSMMIQMSFDNNLFGQIMLEFKEQDQFLISSFNNDLHNYKMMTVPKDAE